MWAVRLADPGGTSNPSSSHRFKRRLQSESLKLSAPWAICRLQTVASPWLVWRPHVAPQPTAVPRETTRARVKGPHGSARDSRAAAGPLLAEPGRPWGASHKR